MKRFVTILLATTALLVGAPHAHAAATITLTTATPSVQYGTGVTLQGVVDPVGAAEALVVERAADGGVWDTVANVTSDAGTGAWSTTTTPQQSSTYRVRAADDSATSTSLRVRVMPIVSLDIVGIPRPFVGARLSISVVPATFSGPVTLRSTGPAGAASRTTWVANGTGAGTAITNGVGAFQVTATTASTRLFLAASKARSVTVRGRTLRRGDSGADVEALMVRLRRLGFLTPGDGRRYTFSASEVALAFQKAYGLPRSYVWGEREWSRITGLTSGPRAKHLGGGTHIEVDKSRQILLFVTDGVPRAIFAVSTGATGNTPVGSFRIIYRRDGYLYRFMGFLGNFGLHGYPSVPPYPASHGCVREPNWAANWIWNNASIGTPVVIYN